MEEPKFIATHVAKADPRSRAGEFFYVDGKDRSEEKVEEELALEKVLGLGIFNPYGTVVEEKFEDDLKRATLAELQSLARRCGLNPYMNNRLELLNAMRKDFVRYKRTNLGAPAQIVRPAAGAAEIAAILEGVEKKG
jgi:hypothetical protein